MADVIAELRTKIAKHHYADGLMVDTAHLAALLDVAEAARAFSDAVAACYPAIESAAVFMHVHGQNYTGPTFGAEHDTLRAALARLEGK